MTAVHEPEVYWTKPSVYAPNSVLPVLVYRNVLPVGQGEEAMKKVLESNNWLKRGIWRHIPKAHYHSTTPECYAPLAGSTRCLYGVSSLDDQSTGVQFDMKAGDIAVHPAGVAHCNLESSEDYHYLGLYPEGAPTVDSIYGELTAEEKEKKVENARNCPVPEYDPIYGFDGPLPKLWREAAATAAAATTATST